MHYVRIYIIMYDMIQHMIRVKKIKLKNVNCVSYHIPTYFFIYIRIYIHLRGALNEKISIF